MQGTSSFLLFLHHIPAIENRWSTIHRRMLAMKGFYLQPGATVLDFGSGDGQVVYEYRDAGFDAYGYDTHRVEKLREPSDEEFFLHPDTIPAPGDYRIDSGTYRITCEDNKFDFVFSVSTLEHTLNHDLAFSECSRILKPGGVSLHVFPARYMRVEPHIYVPYGGALRNYYWYLLWAVLGIRNEYQKNLTARQRALWNIEYAERCLNYPSIENILSQCRKHFSHVEMCPSLWELRIPDRKSFWGSLLEAPFLHRVANWWYNRFCTIVLFSRK